MTAPLRRLFRYVRRRTRYAALTVAFGVLGFGLSYAYPWIIGTVVDTITAPAMAFARREAILAHMIELAALTAALQAVVVYGRGHFNVHLGHGVVTDIRRDLFDHIQSLSMGFFTRERTGDLLSRILHDVHEATALIYTGVIVAAMDVVQVAIAIGLLVAIDVKLTFAVIGLLPLYGLVFAVMNPRVRRASERMQSHFSRIAGNVSEQLAGQALIKTYTAEERESRRLAEQLRHQHGLVVAQSHDGHLVAASGELLVHIGTTVVIGYGGWLALHGEMTAGQVTRYLGYVLILFGPVRRFAELNITYQTSLSAIRRVFDVLDVQPTVVEPPRPVIAPPARGHVSIEGVRFRYPGPGSHPDGTSGAAGARAEWVLDGVSLEAKAGERIAIVGRSGAGKTTLVSLLPRLYDADEGRVVIDGVDVRDYSLRVLRSAIAIVQQETFVFSGTVRDNLEYARPGATDEEILRAAKAAHAHEFISRLPGGYETRLGERAVDLSGGQRQRLSIARAILKDPRILILDEATSALDAESEAVVQSALDSLMGSRTCFVVAHRLSTIRNADRVVVLDLGRVAEAGTHRELLELGGTYRNLVRHQAAWSGLEG